MDDNETPDREEPVIPSATRSAPANSAATGDVDKGQPDAPIDTDLADAETGGFTMERPPVAPNAEEDPLDSEDPNQYPDYDLPDQPEGKRAPQGKPAPDTAPNKSD